MYWIIIIVALLAAYTAWAIRRVYIRKKQGRNCCSSCSSCPYRGMKGCRGKQGENKKNKD